MVYLREEVAASHPLSSVMAIEKNTFLEFPEAPPTPCAATRATTAPCAASRDRCGSDSTCAAAEWDTSSQESSSQQVQSPKAVVENVVSGACAAVVREVPREKSVESAACPVACSEAPTDYRVHNAVLVVNNTFLECRERRSVRTRRSQSFPKARAEELLEEECGPQPDDEKDEQLKLAGAQEQVNGFEAEHGMGMPSVVSTMAHMPGLMFDATPEIMYYHQQDPYTMPQDCAVAPVIFVPFAMAPAGQGVSAPEAEVGTSIMHQEQSLDTIAATAQATETAPQTLAASRKVPRGAVAENGRRDARLSGESRLSGGERHRGRPEVSEHRALELIRDTCDAYYNGRRTQVWSLARKDPMSSALVQKAIEVAASRFVQAQESGDVEAYNQAWYDIEALIYDLHGHVHTAIEHPHANYVIQQVVELLPSELSYFVAEELADAGYWATRHRFGCRVVLRLVRLTHSAGWSGDAARSLLAEVLPYAADLVYDQYGNYVVQELFVGGTPEQKHEAAVSLLSTLMHAATHQHGSRVVESALGCCSEEDSDSIAGALLKSKESVRTLVNSEYGCFVLKALLKSVRHSELALSRLQHMVPELQKTWYARRLVPMVTGEHA
mmetsp:Transcript_64497/g.154013  ORF Transcript_64497/g.154013 Transcript_64497/m.154013 type:complete len:611 (+) Transcript_64497:112-1944(+)|eukprot:CAMPEP_0178389974 /NCGR_PEP_ID=MMETSP0689_2-20121128/10404_1 /TAXON_ID=160604 /ORGANISM="Amphidinium massartii, Strain CS-259" /LENGTH=610 /DNA_ID=CAMNT_0020010463 /DNA_START=112 /DNA_END=1944 /DNA_ORIENTATION=+